MHTIKIERLSKKYGSKKVLNDISFILEPGITAIVGHNGAGKSTLFNILSGRIEPSEGKIFIDDVPFKNSSFESNILFEEAYFYPHLTARENLQYLNLCRGKPLKENEIDELMENWGVCRDTNKSVSQYSLGMKKRYAIAAALINKPDFLILDEPQNGLDVDAQFLVENLFHTYREKGKILLFSSHQMEKVVSLADRLIILHKGEIKLSCSLKELENKAEFISVRTDKNEFQNFLNEKFIKSYRDDGNFLNVYIRHDEIYTFLNLIQEKKLHIYQMETMLPSLYDLLDKLEDKTI